MVTIKADEIKSVITLESPQKVINKSGNDLMALYLTKPQTVPYLYVISGFCEQVLSSVERLNLET